MKKLKLNKFIVFDLELTCWERMIDGKLDKSPPKDMKKEIIQFGYALVENKKIVEKGSWLIKPVDSEISKFCTKLTGITQKDIDEKGISFERFRKELERKGFLNIACTSWGKEDYEELLKECENRNLKMPLSNFHFCCGTMFGLWKGEGKRWGVKRSLDDLGLEFEGDQHDAMWDSYNTARIILNSFFK